MNIIGNNFLSILDSENMSLSCNLGFSNSTGSFDLTILGSGSDINFSFESGKIYDNSGRFVYCYNSSEAVSFSGNFSQNYDYYINGELVSNINYSNYGEVTGINLNAQNCTVAATDIFIKSEKPSIFLSMPQSFAESGSVTGTITNLTPEIGFKIYSGYLSVGGEYFSLESVENQTVEESFSFILQNIKFSSTEYNVATVFSTNYGLVENQFVLSGESLSNITESISLAFSESEYQNDSALNTKALSIYGTFNKYSGIDYDLIPKQLSFDVYLTSGVDKVPFSDNWEIQSGLDEFSTSNEPSYYNSTGYSGIIDLAEGESEFYISLANFAAGADLGYRTVYWEIATEENLFSGIFTGISGG